MQSDNDFRVWHHAVARGETTKERYESVYAELLGLENSIRIYCSPGDNLHDCLIHCGAAMADVFTNSVTPCHFHVPLDELDNYCANLRQARLLEDRPYLGVFFGGRWKVWQDNALEANEVIMELGPHRGRLVMGGI